MLKDLNKSEEELAELLGYADEVNKKGKVVETAEE
jgi:hypothetical protein